MRHPDHKEFQRLVDGELSRRRAHKVSAHVRSCPECAAAVERIRKTGALLRLAVDDMIADAPLEGFSDNVLSAIAREEGKAKLTFSERFRARLGEFLRYRQKVWVPPITLAAAAAAVVLVVLTFGAEAPPIERPPSSTVMSVSFGSSVDGTVFELEDKDGSTTAVIWVDEGKSVASDANSEAKQGIQRWFNDSGTKRT